MANCTKDGPYSQEKPELEANWKALCKEKGISEEIAQKWFADVSARYSETSRHYHTLTHIQEMLNYVFRYESELEDVPAVSFSTWFHDVIYDAKAKDNEEQSAELWKRFAAESGLSSEFTDKVHMYIVATKSHKPPIEGDSDLEFFLDFDMAILASDDEVYDSYAKQIREEYIHVPLDLYIAGRTSILQGFVKQRTFVTPLFDSMLGQKAIKNMEREIQSLPNLKR